MWKNPFHAATFTIDGDITRLMDSGIQISSSLLFVYEPGSKSFDIIRLQSSNLKIR
jgi:hypothetical protein